MRKSALRGVEVVMVEAFPLSIGSTLDQSVKGGTRIGGGCMDRYTRRTRALDERSAQIYWADTAPSRVDITVRPLMDGAFLHCMVFAVEDGK